MERRRETRRTTQDTVRVNVGGRSLRCRMRNLSRSGCMIECAGHLAEVGAPFDVILGPGLIAEGEVAWQLGDSIGVYFSNPIPTSVVREYAIEGWPMDGGGQDHDGTPETKS